MLSRSVKNHPPIELRSPAMTLAVAGTKCSRSPVSASCLLRLVAAAGATFALAAWHVFLPPFFRGQDWAVNSVDARTPAKPVGRARTTGSENAVGPEGLLAWAPFRDVFVAAGDEASRRTDVRRPRSVGELGRVLGESLGKARVWEGSGLGGRVLKVGQAFSTDRLMLERGYAEVAGGIVGDGDLGICFDGEIGLVPNETFGPGRPPAQCVGVVTNAFFAREGTALSVTSKSVYEIGGGCCSEKWGNYLGKEVDVEQSGRQSLRNGPGRDRVIVNLGHHHDTTYYHVLSETIPRYLAVAPLLAAAPDSLVAIGDSDLTESLLVMLGLESNRILRFHSAKVERSPQWTYASVLIMPPATHDEYFLPKELYAKVVKRVLLGAASKLSESRSVYAKNAVLKKPVLVLLERGYSRKRNGSCKQQRCLRNFEALRRTLLAKLGGKYRIEVYPPDGSITTAVRLFSAADMVVGVHGGGFQNLQFCRNATKVVHIGWGNNYKSNAEQYGLDFLPIVIKNLSRRSTNFQLDVDKVVRQIRIFSETIK